jgi:hypothetical protein
MRAFALAATTLFVLATTAGAQELPINRPLVDAGQRRGQPNQTSSAVLNGFSVTLLLGDTKPGPSGDVPAGAAKALADLRDFLPYKSFKVLDSQWAAASGGNLKVRLIVPNNAEYELNGKVSAGNPPLVFMGLSLDRMNGNSAAILNRLLETTVSMSLGETVVVGSSRVQVDTALILLITAVPK